MTIRMAVTVMHTCTSPYAAGTQDGGTGVPCQICSWGETVPSTRAGHGVAVLLKVYAHCSTAKPTLPTGALPTRSAARRGRALDPSATRACWRAWVLDQLATFSLGVASSSSLPEQSRPEESDLSWCGCRTGMISRSLITSGEPGR
jgi:hypothetical protein